MNARVKVTGPDIDLELEKNISLLKQTNEELLRRTIELSKVHEIALSIKSVKSVEEVYELVVESTVDIPGVKFVIIHQKDESGEYITTPYYSRIRNQTVKTALKTMGFDLEKRLGKSPASRKLRLPIAKLKLAKDYLSNRRIIVKERFSELLDGCWSKKLCDMIQKVAGFKKFVIIPLITKIEPESIIIFYLDDDVPQNVLETMVSHCVLAINNVRLLENREKALQNLFESKAMLSNVIESVADGITVTDLNGAIIQVNQRMLNMGRIHSKDEVLGKNFLEFIAQGDRPRALEGIQSLLKGETLLTAEFTAVRTNGSEFPFEVSGALLKDASDNPTGVIVVMRDITERKQAMERLQELHTEENKLRKELETEIDRRIDFTRVLVHELKTPLTPIVVASGILMDEIPEGPLFRLARSINKGALTLNTRIGQLLDVARGELGMLELDRKETNLLELLQRIAEDMTPLSSSREQLFNLELPVSLPPIWIDEERLRQVVVNLLDNSFKFTPEGGKVTLRAKEKDNALIVEVEDTGPGISVDQQQYLFKAYYHAVSENQHRRGLGLGLALSRMLIELHGGQIFVRSQQGKGSTFGFSLQLMPPTP